MILASALGVVGDGTTDNAAALAACIDAWSTQPQKIILPPGKVRTTQEMHLPPGFVFDGEGPGASEIWFQPATSGKRLFTLGINSAPLNYHNQLSNFRIVLMTAGSTGVYLYGAARASLFNVPVESYDVNMGQTGFVIDGANTSGFFNSFINCPAHHVHVGFHFLWSGTTPDTQPTSQTVINCPVLGDRSSGDTSGVGYLFDDWCGEDTGVYNANCENIQTGVKLTGTVRNTRFFNPRFEGNSVDVDLGPSTSKNQFFGGIYRASIIDSGTENSLAGTPSTTTSGTEGTFTPATIVNISLSYPVEPWSYIKSGRLVTLKIGRVVGTCTGSSVSVGFLPPEIRPITPQPLKTLTVSNAAETAGSLGTVLPTGEVLLYSNYTYAGFVPGKTTSLERDVTQYIMT